MWPFPGVLILPISFLFMFIYLCQVCVWWIGTHMSQSIVGSKDNLQGLLLSFHHVSPRNLTLVVRLDMTCVGPTVMASGGDTEHHYGVLLRTSMADTANLLYQQIPPTTDSILKNRVCANVYRHFPLIIIPRTTQSNTCLHSIYMALATVSSREMD